MKLVGYTHCYWCTTTDTYL